MTKYRLFLVGKRSNLLCAYAQNEPMGPLCIPIDNNGTHATPILSEEAYEI